MHFHKYRDWTKLKTSRVFELVSDPDTYIYTEVTMVGKCSVCTKPKFKTYRIS